MCERDSRLESLNVRVSVSAHPSSSILPALAWTSFLRGPSTSFPLSPANIPIQSEFLMSLLHEVVLRTDQPVTFVFCPQGNLRCSMTWKFLMLVWREIMRQKKTTVGTVSLHAVDWQWKPVLDSNQIMDGKSDSFARMHSKKKHKASLYLWKDSLKYQHALSLYPPAVTSFAWH